MDAIEPPRVVFESPAECVDRDRAEQVLRQTLAAARARGWVVTIRIQPALAPVVNAEGEIVDDRGAPRAHQLMSGAGTDCAGLARAMGAWASAALETEGQHAQVEPSEVGETASVNQPVPPLPGPPLPAVTPLASGPSAAPVAPPAQRPVAPQGLLSPSWEPAQKRDLTAPLELGASTFLMIGGAAGGYLGVAPFLIDDVGQAVFLRPSVALGTSMATNVSSTFAAARLDTCLRLPGRYAIRGGLQLDVCGGADGGFSYVASGRLAGTPAMGQTLPYVDLGPAIDLRAEVGRLAVTLRGVGGINIARDSFDDVNGTRVDAPAWSWRLEVAFSWVLHDERTEALMAAQDAF